MEFNLVKFLPLAEFVYYNSIPQSMLITPFWLKYTYHPSIRFELPTNPRSKSQVQADTWKAGREETQ